MRTLAVLSVAGLSAMKLLAAEPSAEWPAWRGPTQNNVAPASTVKPPTQWDANTNVLWRTAVPGRGHSSPIVVGGQVLLTTADTATGAQSVLAFDRATGRLLWQTELNRGGLPTQIHAKNTHATPTLCWDGSALLAVFCHHDGVHLSRLSPDGKALWTVRAGPYKPDRYKFGYAPSPALHAGSVIIASEFDGPDSFLAAFDAQTGKEKWRTPRPANISFSSPVVARLGGQPQILLSGADAVTAYDADTGRKLWSCPGPATATCGTLVWDGERVFASGGYPQSQTLAVTAGQDKPRWTSREKCYEQSMLVHDGHLFAVSDAGIALCWRADTGELRWRARLEGKFSASLVLVGDAIYLANELGVCFVFRANPDKYEPLGRNMLGDETFATPTIVGGQIFLRVAESSGRSRQEWLYCIGSR